MQRDTQKWQKRQKPPDINIYRVGGLNLPLWKMWVKVSYDDDIPNWMESHKIPWFQTTNQL